MPGCDLGHEWKGLMESNGDVSLWCKKCCRGWDMDDETLGKLANALEEVGGVTAVVDILAAGDLAPPLSERPLAHNSAYVWE